MRLEVGKIDKPHGVHGDVVVTLLSNRTERLDVGAVLFRDDGTAYKIKKSRPHQHRYIVEFAEIRGREQAEAVRGTTLYGDPIEDDDTIWVHDLIDSPVIDVNGTELGVVESVLENPASDILVIDNEKFIPLTFFVEQRPDGTIVVDPPVGLFDPIDPADNTD